MKKFTDKDIERDIITNIKRLRVHQEDMIERPLWWQLRGLQQTASGYGKKLTTTHMIHFNNRLHRVYCHCCSNIGSCYILVKGRRIYVD